MNHEWSKAGVNHETHEIHEKRREGEYEPRMDTNGHEWQRNYLTTKHTNSTKKKAGGRVGTTNGHEWQKNYLTTKHTKYTKKSTAVP